VSELFARADPDPTPTAATATSVAGTHKRQISEAVPREKRPNGPETTPHGAATTGFGGCPGGPGGQIQALAQALAQPMTPVRVAGLGSPNSVTEVGCLAIAFLEMDELLRIARIAQ